MEELCQPIMNGRGRPIAPVNIQATDFGLKNHMIQQVQNSCQFHGLPGDDANKHLDKLLTITQSMKHNGVTDDALRLYIFPYSLIHHATAWFDRLRKNSIHTFQEIASKFLSKYFPPSMVTKQRNDINKFCQLQDESLFEAWESYKLSIDRCPNHNMLPVTQMDTFYNGLTLRHRDTINAAAGGTFMKRRPEECYDLIENMTAHHSDWDISAHRGESSTTSSSSEIVALAQQMVEMRKDMLQMFCSNQQVNYVTPSCETYGGPHSYYECQATDGYTQDIYATAGNYNSGGNACQPQGDRNLLSYRSNNFFGSPGNQNQGNNQNFQTIKTNLIKVKGITRTEERPRGALPSNIVPNPREQINSITTRNRLTTAEPSIPPLVPLTPREEVEREPETLIDEVHITSPTSTAHVPPSGIQPVLDKIKLLDKNDVQISKFLKIFKQLHFDISLIDALTQIPKYHKVLKDLLKDKEKLKDLANTSINAKCSAILLNKVPEKLEDPKKFLIPCILQDLKVCNSLADSGASINLMPLSIYEKLRIGSLKPTQMTLELANRSVALPKGIAQDVIVRVDKFNFLTDFTVVDFEADPRVPIILGRPFLRTAKALVDLYKEKLTLRVGNEQVVFYTDKSARNNSRDIQSIHCINIIDFLKDKPISGSTTFSSDSLQGSSFPSSPLVETSDSLLEEFADELALLDPFPLGNKDDNFNPEADLREIKYLLNQDPLTDSLPMTDIDIIDPILKRFTDEPALVYSSPPGDDDDGLFDLKSDNEE
ncbi:reverse transcriptase domain-containing protein [Tanacetum coccineum]